MTDAVAVCYSSGQTVQAILWRWPDCQPTSFQVCSLESFESVDTTAVHLIARCVCGTLLDLDAPGTHGPSYRHCSHSRETFDMALEGLCCDPEFDEHHSLCPRDDDGSAACLAGPIPDDAVAESADARETPERSVAADGGETE